MSFKSSSSVLLSCSNVKIVLAVFFLQCCQLEPIPAGTPWTAAFHPFTRHVHSHSHLLTVKSLQLTSDWSTKIEGNGKKKFYDRLSFQYFTSKKKQNKLCYMRLASILHGFPFGKGVTIKFYFWSPDKITWKLPRKSHFNPTLSVECTPRL